MDNLLEEAQRLLDEHPVYRVDDEVAVVLALQIANEWPTPSPLGDMSLCIVVIGSPLCAAPPPAGKVALVALASS